MQCVRCCGRRSAAVPPGRRRPAPKDPAARKTMSSSGFRNQTESRLRGYTWSRNPHMASPDFWACRHDGWRARFRVHCAPPEKLPSSGPRPLGRMIRNHQVQRMVVIHRHPGMSAAACSARKSPPRDPARERFGVTTTCASAERGAQGRLLQPVGRSCTLSLTFACSSRPSHSRSCGESFSTVSGRNEAFQFCWPRMNELE